MEDQKTVETCCITDTMDIFWVWIPGVGQVLIQTPYYGKDEFLLKVWENYFYGLNVWQQFSRMDEKRINGLRKLILEFWFKEKLFLYILLNIMRKFPLNLETWRI